MGYIFLCVHKISCNNAKLIFHVSKHTEKCSWFLNNNLEAPQSPRHFLSLHLPRLKANQPRAWHNHRLSSRWNNIWQWFKSAANPRGSGLSLLEIRAGRRGGAVIVRTLLFDIALVPGVCEALLLFFRFPAEQLLSMTTTLAHWLCLGLGLGSNPGRTVISVIIFNNKNSNFRFLLNVCTSFCRQTTLLLLLLVGQELAVSVVDIVQKTSGSWSFKRGRKDEELWRRWRLPSSWHCLSWSFNQAGKKDFINYSSRSTALRDGNMNKDLLGRGCRGGVDPFKRDSVMF